MRNEATDQFPEFNQVTDEETGDQSVSKGLIDRRVRERRIFLEGIYE